jgi:SH3 domain-containing protein
MKVQGVPMNRLVVTTLATSVLLFAGSHAGAQTARAMIADTPIRAEANLASPVIATLREGTSVDVVDVQGDWYRVLVPNEPGKGRVGYVLAHLIDVVNVANVGNTDRSPTSIAEVPATRVLRPIAQGPPIPPTLAQISQQHDRATAREQALLTEIDALQSEIRLLRNDQPAGQFQAPRGQISQPRARNPQAREGWWGNVGLGFGYLGCDGCSGAVSGGSGGLSLYVPINARLLVGGGTTGYYRAVQGIALTAGTVDARLRFYPLLTSGFFVTGGLGLGHVSVYNETAYGLGLVFGVGWDLPIRSNVSVTPFWNGVGIADSSGSISFGQLGLGVTVHRSKVN